jgi:quercetin dioxygenase-like cupin family protein
MSPVLTEPWTTRRFTFDYPVERLPVFLDRLRGTPVRIAALARGLPATVLTLRPGGKWSFQEHVGHLLDLESLHMARLGELAAGVRRLRPADMENAATWAARHNERSFASVLADFEASRAALVARLEQWDPARLAASAMHPRLGQPMRVVDVAFFTAEHDDHHLARMHALARRGEAPAPEPAGAHRWRDLPADQPLPLAERRRLAGREAMLAQVSLRAGCAVPVHAHANEQFACVLSGRMRFVLPDGERTLGAGEVLHLPSRLPHGAEALEDSVVLDVFAPPSASTGIDPGRPQEGA